MAIIGKIRSYSGVLIVIIGVALAAFVLGDFMRKGPKGERINLGEIDNEVITYRDFEQRVVEQIELTKRQYNMENIPSEQIFQIRQEVWKQMLNEHILDKQYKEIGLAIDHNNGLKPSISSRELRDLLLGENGAPYANQIVRIFMNKETGQVDKARIEQIINDFDKLEPEAKRDWIELEKQIKADRINTKYQTLIKKGYYVTKSLAKRDYEAKNNYAKVRVFSYKYTAIPDEEIKLTDDDYKNYYSAHKHEYEEKDRNADIEYVVFEVLPTEDDKAKIAERVAKIKQDMEKAENIENFVNSIPDNRYDSTYKKKGSLPVSIDSLVFASEKGKIIGPIIDNNAHLITKVVDFQNRPDSIKMSLIFIAHKVEEGNTQITRSKEEAKAKADSILAVLKKEPAKFNDFVNQFSDDPQTKEKNGDLEWLTDGEPSASIFFNNCINEKVGDFKIVKTDFGYCILHITGKTNMLKKALVAQVKVAIEPSKETDQNIYTTADRFAGENRNIESFRKVAQERGYTIRLAENVREMDNYIPGLSNPREIVRWIFDEKTSKGSVSHVFEFEDRYVVAAVKDIREKGIPSWDLIKNKMEPLVKRDKKAEMMKEKLLAAMKETNNLVQLAQKFNEKVDTVNFVAFASVNFHRFGQEPDVVGTIFTLNKGELSQPIKGRSGMFVLQVDDFVTQPEPADYTSYKMQIVDQFGNKISRLNLALEKSTKIIDNRIKFY